MMRPTVHEIASLLVDICPEETIHQIVDSLLCCQDDDDLSVRQCQIAEKLFGRLLTLAPGSLPENRIGPFKVKDCCDGCYHSPCVCLTDDANCDPE